jgi:hypothetical protein
MLPSWHPKPHCRVFHTSNTLADCYCVMFRKYFHGQSKIEVRHIPHWIASINLEYSGSERSCTDNTTARTPRSLEFSIMRSVLVRAGTFWEIGTVLRNARLCSRSCQEDYSRSRKRCTVGYSLSSTTDQLLTFLALPWYSLEILTASSCTRRP